MKVYEVNEEVGRLIAEDKRLRMAVQEAEHLSAKRKAKLQRKKAAKNNSPLRQRLALLQGDPTTLRGQTPRQLLALHKEVTESALRIANALMSASQREAESKGKVYDHYTSVDS